MVYIVCGGCVGLIVIVWGDLGENGFVVVEVSKDF